MERFTGGLFAWATTNTTNNFMKDFKTHFIYWILPGVVTLVCILLYFFNFFRSSAVISPAFNREFGVLENLQLMVLTVIAALSIKAIGKKEDKYEKYIFTAITVLSVFLLLEEIDYGLHYYELLTGQQQNISTRNVHNNGKITGWFKMSSYIFLVLFFVLFPFISRYTKDRFPFLYYISPSNKIITTLICLVLLNQLAFYFYKQDIHTNRSLDGNVSEFEELLTYYIVLLYIRELAKCNKTFPGLFGMRVTKTQPLQ